MFITAEFQAVKDIDLSIRNEQGNGSDRTIGLRQVNLYPVP